jgi:nucleoid DNA-binding protein
MANTSKGSREELVLRVQAALSLTTKKEADCLVNVFVSCLEEMLVEHLTENGYFLKLNGLGKFIIRHTPLRRRKIGFSGETSEIPPKCKVRFVALGKLRQLGTVTSEQR